MPLNSIEQDLQHKLNSKRGREENPKQKQTKKKKGYPHRRNKTCCSQILEMSEGFFNQQQGHPRLHRGLNQERRTVDVKPNAENRTERSRNAMTQNGFFCKNKRMTAAAHVSKKKDFDSLEEATARKAELILVQNHQSGKVGKRRKGVAGKDNKKESVKGKKKSKLKLSLNSAELALVQDRNRNNRPESQEPKQRVQAGPLSEKRPIGSTKNSRGKCNYSGIVFWDSALGNQAGKSKKRKRRKGVAGKKNQGKRGELGEEDRTELSQSSALKVINEISSSAAVVNPEHPYQLNRQLERQIAELKAERSLFQTKTSRSHVRKMSHYESQGSRLAATDAVLEGSQLNLKDLRDMLRSESLTSSTSNVLICLQSLFGQFWLR